MGCHVCLCYSCHEGPDITHLLITKEISWTLWWLVNCFGLTRKLYASSVSSWLLTERHSLTGIPGVLLVEGWILNRCVFMESNPPLPSLMQLAETPGGKSRTVVRTAMNLEIWLWEIKACRWRVFWWLWTFYYDRNMKVPNFPASCIHFESLIVFTLFGRSGRSRVLLSVSNYERHCFCTSSQVCTCQVILLTHSHCEDLFRLLFSCRYK